VVGKCREWTEEQVETAAVLCLVYGKFIEVRIWLDNLHDFPNLMVSIGVAAEGSRFAKQSTYPTSIGKLCS
jgi:hypothetical protein